MFSYLLSLEILQLGSILKWILTPLVGLIIVKCLFLLAIVSNYPFLLNSYKCLFSFSVALPYRIIIPYTQLISQPQISTLLHSPTPTCSSDLRTKTFLPNMYTESSHFHLTGKILRDFNLCTYIQFTTMDQQSGMTYGKQEPVLIFFNSFWGQMNFQIPNFYDSEVMTMPLSL